MTHYEHVSDSLLENLSALLHKVHITQTHMSQGLGGGSVKGYETYLYPDGMLTCLKLREGGC